VTNERIEFDFDACRDALAVLPERYVASLFGLVVETVSPRNGVLSDLWMRDTDDAE
jgi:hypothetical protein